MPGNKPNILFLMSDEHRRDILGYAGDPIVRTPRLDALAENAAGIHPGLYAFAHLHSRATSDDVRAAAPNLRGGVLWSGSGPRLHDLCPTAGPVRVAHGRGRQAAPYRAGPDAGLDAAAGFRNTHGGSLDRRPGRGKLRAVCGDVPTGTSGPTPRRCCAPGSAVHPVMWRTNMPCRAR